MLNRRAAAIPISIAGSDVPIFLLDGTALIIRAMPATTAGAACCAVSARLGLVADRHHALFERGPDNEFRAIDDSMTLARVLSRWSDQASYLSGAFLLLFSSHFPLFFPFFSFSSLL